MPNIAQLEKNTEGLLVRAPAKINLCLLIAGKRPDGFHEIKTLMAKVDWFDELLFQEGEQEGIELVCMGKYWAPGGRDNLVYRAIELFAKNAGITPKIKITLTKNIPAGSGLGSASSDAAAALIGFNEFTKTKFNKGVYNTPLQKMAAELGSDVPFFLGGPQAVCMGRGEKLVPLNEKFQFSALLVLPNVNTSTKRVYENYKHNKDEFLRLNSAFDRFLGENRVDLIVKMCANMLRSSCFALHPEIALLKEQIENTGMKPLCLSGSGSTLFSIMYDRDLNAMERERQVIKSTGCECVLVKNNSW